MIKKYSMGIVIIPLMITLLQVQGNLSSDNKRSDQRKTINEKSKNRMSPFHIIHVAGAQRSFVEGETPASIACVYGLTSYSSGCNPAIVTQNPQGGWGTIAIVGAFHSSTAENDLNVFSRQFGLPECTTANGKFTQITLSHETPPESDPAWAAEVALDIEWAHAMAPNAKIALIEAVDNYDFNLLAAVQYASDYVHAQGGGEISMSWGGPENSERDFPFDDIFKSYPDIIYVAASGDLSAPGIFPGVSPWVVSAGGSSIVRDALGNFIEEKAWNEWADGTGPGGGPSLFQLRPTYQNFVQKVVGSARGTPDFSFDADPDTGVLIYCSQEFFGGWGVVGGTSVSAPALAGIINAATEKAMSTQQLLALAYVNAAKGHTACWRQITSGYNGYYAARGYNFVTGLGTPFTYDAFKEH